MTARLALLFVTSTLFSFALTPLVRRAAWRFGAVDPPSGAKLHTAATPRLGGVAVVAACALATVVDALMFRGVGPATPVDLALWAPVLAGAAFVFVAGVWDDLRPVSPATKLAFQAAAACAAIALGVRVEHVTLFGSVYDLGPLALPLTFLWVVGVTNAFNLVDGLDGLAAGLAIIASSTCLAILLMRGDEQGALLLVLLVGAAVGFLPYNSNPATIFLGDSGSMVFGFVLATTAIMRWQKGATALAVGVPLLVLGLPIADTLWSIGRRLARRDAPGTAPSRGRLARRLAPIRRVVEADHGHIHHRLVRRGLSHRTAVLALYAVSLCLSLLALAAALAS